MTGFKYAVVSFVITISCAEHRYDKLDFNRKNVGVALRPYPFTDEMDIHPDYSTYTEEDLSTMLKVVSERFSRVIIDTVDAQDEPYRKGASYYHYTNIRARTAELAANVNAEKASLAITVLLGIWDDEWNNSLQAKTEMQVALEAYEIANSTFPGTVEGLFLSNFNMESFAWANETLNAIKTIRSLNPDLRIGSKQNCQFSPGNETLNANVSKIVALRRDIILNSDFIICEIEATDKIHNQGGWFASKALQSVIHLDRSELLSLNERIDVMIFTGWTIREGKETNMDIDSLMNYWINFNHFATESNLTVWLEGVFDTYYPFGVTMGWCKLKSYDLINTVSGYVEKISTLPIVHPEPKHSSINNVRPESTVSLRNNISNMALWILAGSCFIAVGLSIFVGITCIFCRNLHSYPSLVLTRKEIKDFRRGLETVMDHKVVSDIVANMWALKQPYNKLLEIPKQNLEIDMEQFLGGGEHGYVFKALLRDPSNKCREVALKLTKPDNGTHALKGLLSEIKILSHVGHHRNIVAIVGAYTAEISGGTAYLVTEICPLGSLKIYLRHMDISDGTDALVEHFEDIFRWSHDIACGMEFLERKGVIHADLAARNVLLSADKIAKITDFGLSRRLYEYDIYTKTQTEPLPWRWMAFEALKMSEFSSKSDVWSYGVTLWEIFSFGAQPYSGLTWTLEFVDNLMAGFRLPKPRHASPETFRIIEKCWNLEKDDRPTFSELTRSFHGLQGISISEEVTK